jgi:tight adherence protein B
VDPILLISIAAFLGVSALVAGLLTVFRADTDNRVEDRLDLLTGARSSKADSQLAQSVLHRPLDAVPGVFDAVVERFQRLRLLFDQADTSLKPSQFAAISAALGCAAMAASAFGGLRIELAPVAGVTAAALPLLWLMFKRRQRLKKFAVQLPDALELISRALRAGHSLASGFNLVHDEMSLPRTISAFLWKTP